MATAELGDWHVAKCRFTKDEQELTIFEETTEGGGPIQVSITGLPAILALRDLIDEEVANADARGEMEREVMTGDP